MKKLASILLLALFLFHLYGYQAFFDYLGRQRDRQLAEELLRSPALTQEFVSIKVAAILPPYASDSREFEWVNGEVTLQGVIYRYVQRRIFRDSVEYRCLVHEARMQVEEGRRQLLRTGQDPTGKEGGPSILSVAWPLHFESLPLRATALLPASEFLSVPFLFPSSMGRPCGKPPRPEKLPEREELHQSLSVLS